MQHLRVVLFSQRFSFPVQAMGKKAMKSMKASKACPSKAMKSMKAAPKSMKKKGQGSKSEQKELDTKTEAFLKRHQLLSLLRPVI